MKMKHTGNLVVVVIVLVSIPAFGQPLSFQGVGDLPGGSSSSQAYAISSNGAYVVGASSSASGTEAFIWHGGTMSALGDLSGGDVTSIGYGVSDDGSVVVGVGRSWLAIEAVRWVNGNIESLGVLPGGMFVSISFGLSSDGQVIVGVSASSNGLEAFRWSGGTMSGLGDLPGGGFESSGFSVSNDGSIVVGMGQAGLDPNGEVGQPFLWDSGGMTILGGLGGARAVSGDGSVVVGDSVTGGATEAFRWEAGGLTSLGDLPGGDTDSIAWDTSTGGAVVVGRGQTAGGDEAFIWTSHTGMMNLREVLTNDYGLDLAGWSLTSARGISDDGMTITGEGVDPSGSDQGWVAHVYSTLTLDVVNPTLGTIEVEPNQPKYALGTAVTLTATPNEGKSFVEWRIFDPNHPDDANYVTIDSNTVTTVVMYPDRRVKAVFKCGSSVGSLLPTMIVATAIMGFMSRRRSARRRA